MCLVEGRMGALGSYGGSTRSGPRGDRFAAGEAARALNIASRLRSSRSFDSNKTANK
jgi:hypothetical protein